MIKRLNKCINERRDELINEGRKEGRIEGRNNYHIQKKIKNKERDIKGEYFRMKCKGIEGREEGGNNEGGIFTKFHREGKVSSLYCFTVS